MKFQHDTLFEVIDWHEIFFPSNSAAQIDKNNMNKIVNCTKEDNQLLQGHNLLTLFDYN